MGSNRGRISPISQAASQDAFSGCAEADLLRCRILCSLDTDIPRRGIDARSHRISFRGFSYGRRVTQCYDNPANIYRTLRALYVPQWSVFAKTSPTSDDDVFVE